MAFITSMTVRADTAADSADFRNQDGAGRRGDRPAALVASSGRLGSTTIRSSLDDSVVGSLPLSCEEDVERAFRTARVAQAAWAERPIGERTAVFRRFAELVLEERSALLDVIQLETGKARLSAFEEVADVSRWASYAAHTGPQHLRERRRTGAFPLLTRTRERFVPKGVVGIITPWNYPFTLPAGDAIPALLAGNAVLLKPDSQTPHTALFALGLLHRAGLPRDLMQIVLGPGSRIGPAMIERSDFMMFTGSTATGRAVAEGCASQLIGCSAELGGKNPMLVLADADARRAATGAVNACFSNSVQLCVSVERIYVHRDLWADFVSAFLERVRAMRLAAGLGWDPDMGSLIGAHQLEAVTAQVDDAVAHGATVLAGGRARPDLGPYFYEPTVLTGIRPGMKVAREETFGPVVSLYRVDSEEEAIAAANDSGPRAELQRLVEAPRARSRPSVAVRHGQHQRGLRGSLGLPRCADGRDEVLRSGPPPRRRGLQEIHRAADHRGTTTRPGRGPARAGTRTVVAGPDRRRPHPQPLQLNQENPCATPWKTKPS